MIKRGKIACAVTIGDVLPTGITTGELWQHHSGRVYEVIGFANLYTEKPDKHPVHVLYLGQNGRLWTRPLTEFRQKFWPLSKGAPIRRED